ncbi:MAG: PEP-CTERM sorting domain-containing protein [Planctomycetes bacterium]|nr:PEP-CTERM sorting domain-containing protein [Planctomycetota bacterium]
MRIHHALGGIVVALTCSMVQAGVPSSDAPAAPQQTAATQTVAPAVDAHLLLVDGKLPGLEAPAVDPVDALDTTAHLTAVPEPASMVMMLGLSMLGVLSRPRHGE